MSAAILHDLSAASSRMHTGDKHHSIGPMHVLTRPPQYPELAAQSGYSVGVVSKNNVVFNDFGRPATVAAASGSTLTLCR